MREQETKYEQEILKHISESYKDIDFNKFSIIKKSSEYQDKHLSFDMLFTTNFNVSVRIRQNKYKIYQDLTIRSQSENYGKTEIDKILEGKAQVYFYAYENKKRTKLEHINICDVDIIRELYKLKKYKVKANIFDNTKFMAFDFKDIKDIANNSNMFFITIDNLE